MPMRRAEDSASMGKAVRAHLYRIWLSEESRKSCGGSRTIERAWRARTAPGTIRGVHAYRSSLCKGFSTMSHTTSLRTLIQAPDLLVMPGVFDGFSARLVEQSGFAAG